MKRKTLIILSTLVILSFVGGSAVSGFTVSSVDGVWGYIDGVTTTSNYYPVDGLGYAREGVRAPLQEDQGYRLLNTVCAPMQNITPPGRIQLDGKVLASIGLDLVRIPAHAPARRI